MIDTKDGLTRFRAALAIADMAGLGTVPLSRGLLADIDTNIAKIVGERADMGYELDNAKRQLAEAQAQASALSRELESLTSLCEVWMVRGVLNRHESILNSAKAALASFHEHTKVKP